VLPVQKTSERPMAGTSARNAKDMTLLISGISFTV
jgi:hypothetical protein